MTEGSESLLWGKLGLGNYPEESHPVICHLLDVGNSCLTLWNRSLGDELRIRWAQCLSTNVEMAGQWIAFWAAVHDIGKISPGFQFKSPAAKQRLKSLGFPLCSAPVLPHARLSAVYLQDELSGPRNGAWPAVSKKMAACVAAVVGGHHGVIPGAGELRNCRNSLGQGAWVKARSRVMTLIADEFSVASAVPPCELIPEAGGFWLFLAGLISVSDWVGSNAKFFQTNGRWAGADFDLDAYRQQSRQRAEEAVRQLGFGRWSARRTGCLSFTTVHPEIHSPRPLQKCCVEIASKTTEPQLVLIEAPMGEGKTEAAVYLADHSSHVLGGRGMYIALPTQATSNQMFDRIETWLRQRYDFEGDHQRINLQLLHGRTGFSEAFCKLLKLAEIDTTETQTKSHRGDETNAPSASVLAESWFAQNRKQQLLAPFGVGTIDQLLMAVLQTKHHFVRLFGLSAKTVILDEVHAYDAYMTTLMERLLEWLAGLGCPVVLLSATLPSERRKKLIEAYTGRAVTLPCDTYPRITVAKRGDALIASHAIETDPARHLTIRMAWLNETEFVTRLQDVLGDGGCVGIVCNTVQRAQNLFQLLADAFQEHEVSLFHARFPVADRMRIEGEVLESLGRPIDNSERPPRMILVATQVIEQSLDLDFDLLISDVAPIDLILQRAGRLHRHPGRQRPSGLDTPQLWLVKPVLDEVSIPDFGTFQSGFTEQGKYRPGIYDRHILLRTWLTLIGGLSSGQMIHLPNDLERLVENVYTPPKFAAFPADWRSEMERTWEGLQQGIQNSESKATDVRVPAPNSDDLLTGSRPELDEDDPGVHRSLQAVTREGDPSMTLVLLYERDGLLYLDAEAIERVDPESAPTPLTTLELLKRSLSISNRFWVNHLKAQEVPAGWRKSGALCYARPVALNASGRYSTGTHHLRFDLKLGLVFEREES